MSKFSIEVKEILADVKKEKENLESGKVKMNEVREENERLKLTLSQMMEEYHSLKMHLNDIVQQDEEPKKFMDSNSDDSDLVSLCLGRVSAKKVEKKNISNENIKQLENGKVFDGLELGLECKFHLENSTKASKDNSPEKCSEGSKEDVNNESRARDKSPKNSRSEDDDVLLQNPLKKPRVSIRAVCDTQTLNDGCQWRKYGQKIAKGNPCPRAYYRCTLSSSCPVRKQVQRCADNMSILITTYEGAHNHPLPASATTMASTTTAAAAMLNCGSTTSSTNHNNLLGFQFTSSNHHLPNSYFPRASISTSQSHPTVILDLTTPPNPSSSLFNKFIPSTLFSSPLSSSSSLNFSHSNTLKTTWDAKIHTTNHISTSSYMATTSQPYNYKKNQEEIVGRDEIAIATKAITRDPTFQSALAAAITSFVGNGTSNASTSSQERDVKLSHDQMDFQLSFSQPSTRNGIVACATSYLNKFNDQTMTWQQKNLSSFPPFTIVSTSKSVASTPTLADHEGDNLLKL